MQCPNCGAENSDSSFFCTMCGSSLSGAAAGAAGAAGAVGADGVAGANGAQPAYEQPAYEQQAYGQQAYGQPVYGMPAAPAVPANSKSKIAAGLFAILLGPLGIHKFYLGYTTAGVIMLLVSLLTLGLGAIVMQIIGLIEGILYLTKTDEEFYAIYVQGEKAWF